VAGFCENSNEPLGCIEKAGYYLTSCVTINFSKNILHHGVSEQVSKTHIGEQWKYFILTDVH
jgi:hypothetical protein